MLTLRPLLSAAPFAYSINEMNNTCTPLRYDAAAGALSVIDGGTISVLPADSKFAEYGGAAEITCSNDGKHVYASVRCTGGFNCCPPSEAGGDEQQHTNDKVFNRIAALSLDAETGACALVDDFDSGGSMPWSHCWASDLGDDLLLVQNQHTK